MFFAEKHNMEAASREAAEKLEQTLHNAVKEVEDLKIERRNLHDTVASFSKPEMVSAPRPK